MPSAKATPADKESATTVPAFMAPNPLGFHTLPYWRFDALAEYQLNKNISMQLNVVNLTNELYYGALHQSNTPLVFAAPGRAAYLTVNVKY